MDASVNQVTIFLPVLVVVALTAVAVLRMFVTRARAMKERPENAGYYRIYQGPPEPEYAVVAARHYGNLFESPVVFYAGSIAAFALACVTPWLLAWAWGYVICRVVQSTVHLTFNNPLPRGIAFTVSWLFLVALWVTVAMAVFARL